jgi:hypothetical protein
VVAVHNQYKKTARVGITAHKVDPQRWDAGGGAWAPCRRRPMGEGARPAPNCLTGIRPDVGEHEMKII